ncbi:hypothetical protein Kpol_1076p3 [Vanderwaltozyma polyspora DSM 70294]|uniref:tRNA:m(4)X modification enzyme TRM13 n=1 Tax=Vanderwaltozyma polyspora (strain ATCC 22028 / DSM 70294 / BCRC 21397 / CBS 2163 / NBRC 10782 / NRRL Y-8283 / UCD 57-17) TaxID=436907 RepID=TRM13_VANPO|nr:uncharacterized protein Kpol_1076p3 [Vanderwaltozyma polyspora DSM 70294]A7TSF4.1 RecName: Full=tRNA:m(4)X modification enzyme TRM13; AltName: Full=tRNA methylase 13 [Vanderwaltozyma polyspora DSM 70294]EDO14797.1 hypothetical protein Kpol_1076p3 [Vanderwaltozyma polyspora DSM 70294]
MQPESKKQRLQCEFYMEKKKRRCGMSRNLSSKYCSEHQILNENTKRIPCPLDPNHTVWESDLDSHLKKCNKLKLIHQHDNKPYFLKDCNAITTEDSNTTVITKDSLQNWIMKTIPVLKNFFKDDEKNYLSNVPLDIRKNHTMEDKRFPQLNENDNIGKKYHAIQQSSLIQNMIDRNILQFKENSLANFIEFGCGRAELSRYVNQVVIKNSEEKIYNPHFILIDRSTNRMKFDTKMKKDALEFNQNLNPPTITRIRIDIKDLKIDPLLQKDSKYIAISKHLCGVATDLTLRSLTYNPDDNDFLQGVCIAMCCRHVCNSNNYVNPDFVKSIIGNTNTEEQLPYDQFFHALTKIAAWATSGDRPTSSDENNTHFTNLPYTERQELGLMARRVIDQGRCDWLQQKLGESFKVELIRYVEPSISLENVALLAYRK